MSELLSLFTSIRRRNSLLVLVTILVIILALAIIGAPAPHIESAFGGASVNLRADRSWTLLPGHCATISWKLEGIQSVYIDDEKKIHIGDEVFCPSLGATRPSLVITAANGNVRTLSLGIHYLPADMISSLLLTVILVLLLLSIYYSATHRLAAAIRINATHVLAVVALLLICLLFQTGDALNVGSMLDGIVGVFVTPAWQMFGLLLAGLIFIPLLVESLKKGLKSGSRQDIAAIVAFFLFVFLLYLPFGFDSVGHWEEWVFRAYLEGRPSFNGLEMVSRFWILVPNVFANLLNYGSFSGYHLVNLMMFWFKLVLFYGILRQLRVHPYFAFLCTMLFMVYPVTSGLMSLRFFLMQFRILSLFAMVYTALAFYQNPGRLRLAGLWMATLLNVGSYESAYALIAVIPILWLRKRPRWSWRNINMTLIWYLFPAAKGAYVLLSGAYGQGFYGSHMVEEMTRATPFDFSLASYYADVIEKVFRQTFWYGWREAVTTLGDTTWIVPTAIALAVVAVAAAYLARRGPEVDFPPRRTIGLSIICGLLFILPSIGVLMWIPKYAYDLRRLYVYVPIGAAIAMFGLFMILVLPIRVIWLRKLLLALFCLVAMFPALTRLYAQHAYYVSSANSKASILLQAVEQAPALDSDTHVILLTRLTGAELRAKNVSKLRTNMVKSAFHILYEEDSPELAFLCIIDVRCFVDLVDLPGFQLHEDLDYSHVVLFLIHDDLSVELRRELPPELNDGQNHTYDPEPLIDTSAPIPPRALTMLASARRVSARP